MIGRDLERPRFVLVSTRLGPPVELARWLLELRRIPNEERAHAHAFVSKGRRVGFELPLVHCCAGRDFNARQTPSLVAHFFRARAETVERYRLRGPFPDELIVRLGAG